MRVVLAVGLFAIGVELPESYMMKHVRGLVVLVIPTMAIGWIIVAGMCPPPSANSLPRHLSSVHVGALPISQLRILLGNIRLLNSNRSGNLRRYRRYVPLDSRPFRCR